MFKKIIIHLTEPICSCENEDLAWTVYRGQDNKNCFLLITCKTCNTRLEIPNEKFVAGFELEKEYPKCVLEKNKEKEQTKDEKFLKNMGIVPNFKADI